MWGPEELQPPVSSQDLVLQAMGFRHPLPFLPSLPSRLPCSHAGAGPLWSFFSVLRLFVFVFVAQCPAQAPKTRYEHCLEIAALFGQAVPLWLPSLSSTFGLVESSHARLDSHVYELEI